MFGRRFILTVAGGALVVGLALGLLLHRPRAVEPIAALLPAINLRQASIVLRHHGEKQAEVHAERVQVSRDLRYATFVGSPSAEVFDAGREILRIRGTRIVLDRHTSDVTVYGPVEVTTSQGGRLSAGAARWSNATQQVVFQQGVRLAQGDQELTAEQVTVDLTTQVIDLFGDVDVAFRMERARP